MWCAFCAVIHLSVTHSKRAMSWVSNASVPCLTDFGLSKIVSETQGFTTSAKVGGSSRWMAPELLEGKKLTIESDVWAYGMTILVSAFCIAVHRHEYPKREEIYTGKRPFCEITLDAEVLLKVVDGQHPPRPASALAPALTDEIWITCQNCWNTQPTLRPLMNGVLASLQTPTSRINDIVVRRTDSPPKIPTPRPVTPPPGTHETNPACKKPKPKELLEYLK